MWLLNNTCFYHLNKAYLSLSLSQAKTKAPKVADRGKVTKLTPMPDTGAMMCIIGRGMLRQLIVKRHELVKVTERMVAANGHQLTLDGAVFLDLTAGGRKSVQMVYVSPDVNHTLLSQIAWGWWARSSPT